jgi:hypothetical protein
MVHLEGETLAARLAHAFEAATTIMRFDQRIDPSSGQCLDAVNAAVPRDVHLIVDN